MRKKLSSLVIAIGLTAVPVSAKQAKKSKKAGIERTSNKAHKLLKRKLSKRIDKEIDNEVKNKILTLGNSEYQFREEFRKSHCIF